jgi:hypothetical protein
MRYAGSVRTTLDIADDVLAQAKTLAQRKGLSLGEIISDLARKSLTGEKPPTMRNGVPLLRSRPNAPRPDLELVNRLRDEQ